ncbi:MAG: DUF5615 family PIN-like protein [Ignavibacteriae bacterium]|nr:DUF5615 family PIN-like protein [Ignavibacteriota bacterium]
MNILADHCVYGKTVRLLKDAGHRVVWLKEIADPASPDDIVLSLASSSNSVLVSNDKDFADIVKYPPKEHLGIIVLRITPENEDNVHSSLLAFLEKKTIQEIQGTLVVIRGDKVRIRK